jgi:hypothetical protein
MHAELERQHLEELALDAGNVAFAEDAGAECPVGVLEGGVVEVLAGDDECAEEDAVVSPF